MRRKQYRGTIGLYTRDDLVDRGWGKWGVRGAIACAAGLQHDFFGRNGSGLEYLAPAI
jgi:hypothetical protein